MDEKIAGHLTSAAPMEAGMPRFVGKKTRHIWWELLAVIVLVLVILLVLEFTGTANIFS